MAGLNIVSWDSHNINDGTNYSASFSPATEWGLPAVTANVIERVGQWPKTTTLSRKKRRLGFWIKVEDCTDTKALREQLMQWFDPEDESPNVFAIEDAGGGNTRYVNAICEQCTPVIESGMAMKNLFAVVLTVDGDVRWRDTIPDSDVWSITASGQTNVLANDGTDDAFPIFTIEPTGALTGGYPYKIFIPIRWRVDRDYKNYPVDIVNNSWDTTVPVGAAKMQADGDDLRVEVDGVEVDRWLQDMNDATTQVWCNLNFKAKAEVTLATAIAGAGAITTIDAASSIKKFPSHGILIIDSEAFSYTGKIEAKCEYQFTGVTRSVNGTAAAAHTTTDTIWWCQHDLWIRYGDATATAPSTDDDYKPAFALTSTNTSWVYTAFGDDEGKRTGAWSRNSVKRNPTFTTANQGTDASPWTDIGIHAADYAEKGMWFLYNPCAMTNANFTNGEKWSDHITDWSAGIYSSKKGCWPWTLEDSIAAPALASNWEAWSDNEALTAGSLYVGMYIRCCCLSKNHKVEVSDVTVTLNSSYTPTLTVGAEQGGYTLDAEIENQTTGDKIGVVYHLALNEELEVNTDAHTVTDLETGLSQFQAVSFPNGAQKDWLPLQPGNNTLCFTATGTNAVTLTTEWYKRWY